MDFPKVDFGDEEACFTALIKRVHPEGLRCPLCGRQEELVVCRHHKKSWIVDYRCPTCGCVFNAWTGTPFQGTHHSPSELWRIITKIKQGKFTTEIARKLDCQRAHLSEFRHEIQQWVTSIFGSAPKKSPRKRPRSKAKKPRSSRKRRS